MSIRNRSESNSPAYKEPWFWMIMLPLILVVCVCSVLIYFAYSGADDRVLDDYYQKGRLINKQFVLEQKAIDLDVRGELRIDSVTKEALAIVYSLESVPSLNLVFSHPVDASNDRTIELKEYAPNRYRADLTSDYPGHWYLVMSSFSAEHPWRIVINADFNQSDTVLFSARKAAESIPSSFNGK